MSNNHHYHGYKADIIIQPGTDKVHCKIVARPHNGELPLKELENAFSSCMSMKRHEHIGTDYDQKTHATILSYSNGITVRKTYDPIKKELTLDGVPHFIIPDFSCQEHTRTIDMTHLHDQHLRYRIHHGAHLLGITVY